MDNKIRVAMVVTRSLEIDMAISRVRIMREIRDALSVDATVDVYRIRTLPEIRRATAWIRALFRFFRCSFAGATPALQCLLYSDHNEVAAVVTSILAGDYSAVYIDSVRSIAVINELRKRAPALRVVVDFDDLMSRRMELISKNNWPVQLGHIGKMVPSIIRRQIEGNWSRAISRFEAKALCRAESKICDLAQAIVLISPLEARLLKKQVPKARARIRGVLPAQRAVSGPIVMNEPLRFVFVGSDGNGQNLQSIQFLRDLWSRTHQPTQLHIYGRQRKVYKEIPNVIWHGYVQDINDVYTDNSILVMPVFRLGGIKTKLLEAWGHGRPALVNAPAMEGIPIDNYPLVISEEDWGAMITEPGTYAKILREGAELGRNFVRDELSPEVIARTWTDLVFGYDEIRVASRNEARE